MLKDIYYGKIIPWERRLRNDKTVEQRGIVNKIEAEERYFASKMSDEDRQRFQALSNLYSELSSSSEAEIFSYGFSMGLLLMVNVMDEAEIMAARGNQSK